MVEKARIAEAKPAGAEIPIADLKLLSTRGRLDEGAELIAAGRFSEFFELAKRLRERETVPYSASIVEKSVKQHVESTTMVREMGQNCLNAYKGLPGMHKTVEYELEEEGGHYILTARDRGCGMTEKGIYTDLLNPLKSGWVGMTRGEHGVGFFSTLQLAERVFVATGTGGPATLVEVTRREGKWVAVPRSLPGETMQGTEVVCFIPKDRTTFGALSVAVARNLGLIDAEEFEITFNHMGKTEKLNILGRDYKEAAAVEVTTDRGTGTLRLSLTEKERAWHERVTVTLGQLWLSSRNNEFPIGSLEYSLMDGLTGLGKSFWFDLPEVVGSVKVRTGIAQEHAKAAFSAEARAFREYVLKKVLPDPELVQKLGPVVSEVFEKIFKKSYVESAELPKAEVSRYGRDHFKNLRESQLPPEREKLRTQAFADLLKATGFARGLIETQFLPALKRVGDAEEKITISIKDMVDASSKGLLHDLRQKVAGDGIYIDSDSPQYGPIFGKIISMLSSAAQEVSASAASQTVVAGEKAKAFEILRSPLPVVRKAVEAAGAGWEYVAFLECSERLEEAIAEAMRRGAAEEIARLKKRAGESSGEEQRMLLAAIERKEAEAKEISPAPLMVHSATNLLDRDVAHTNLQGISMNLTGPAKSILSSITRGTFGAKEFHQLVFLADTLMHERGHFCLKTAYHDAEFDESKRYVRYFLWRHYGEQEVFKLFSEMQAIVAKYDYSRPLSLEELGKAIQKATAKA